MKDIIETLYPMNACLLGEGYDNRLEYIKHLIDLKVIDVPSGTQFGTWVVPDEWVVRDAWVKLNGEKIIDFKVDPMSLVVGSLPFQGTVTKAELMEHLNFSEENPDSIPYTFNYYDKKWGFSVAKNKFKEKIVYDENGNINCEGGDCNFDLKEIDPLVGKVQIEGVDYKPKFKDALPEGDYEVFIDTEYKKGVMKLGVHTIKGELDKEILLFAHLDHPYQANDNLSGVACLVDLATKIKSKYTIKIILCPETIGSVAYGATQDLSNVEFVLAVDICGNTNSLLMQKSWDTEHRINRVAHVALQGIGESFRKGNFRNTIGSDEYYFNDPAVGIQGILLSTHPYKEYHTNNDTPEKIDYAQIEKTQKAIQKIIEVWENDFIPVRKFKGPLMRSRYQVQTSSPQLNLSYDYMIYSIDGKRSLAELCCEYGLNFDFTLDLMLKLETDGQISRSHIGEIKIKKASRKKSA
jgi:aminopeptidase-like protein